MPTRDIYPELRERLAMFVDEHPGLTGKEIAEHLQVSERICSAQLKKLLKKRRIAIKVETNTRGQGQRFRYFPRGYSLAAPALS